jgi:ribonuclease PH
MSSEAARKAWVTRRANQQKRSEAAHKAWETRRSKAEANTEVEASSVIEQLHKANKMFDKYVKQRVSKGYRETRVKAAIKAHVARLELQEFLEQK